MNRWFYFIGKQLALTFIVVWLSASLVFWALRIVPGDAIYTQLTQVGASQEIIEERRAELGLTDPVIIQYFHFLANLVQGNLGNSLYSGQTVTEMITQRLPSTASLATFAIVIASSLGLALGILSGLRLGYKISIMAQLIVRLLLSVPVYWTGTILLVLLIDFPISIRELLLPAMVLGIHTAAAIARVIESSIGETLNADFVRTAQAKGLSESQIVWRHILPAGLIPIITVIALQAGFLFGGTVIVESIFNRPGLGRLLLDATLQQDYAVVQGIVILIALVYTLLNQLVEVTSIWIDPRIAAYQ